MTASAAARRAGRMLLLAASVLVALLLLAPLVTPLATGARWIVVEGGSMQPAISYGDVIVVAPPPETGVAVGDIVTVRAEGGLVTHRVVAVSDGAVHTRGDANRIDDSDPVALTDLVGVVVGTVGQPWAALIAVTSTLPARIALLAAIVALMALRAAVSATAPRADAQPRQ